MTPSRTPRSRRLPLLTAVTAVLSMFVVALGPLPAQAIVGGEDVPRGKLRFMVSLQQAGSQGSDGHFCGGSVVARRWVLTAAHCVDGNTKPKSLQVVVGRTDLARRGGQVLRVTQIKVHPKWAKTDTHDAALLRTAKRIKAPRIRLVPRRNQKLERSGAALTVAGWGTEFFGSPTIPSRMKRVDVEAVSDADCTTNGLMGFKPRTELCAETLGGDSCQGDSGGPLFGNLPDGRRVQVGIVSYGLGCAVPKFPGVYAEVNSPRIRPFLARHLG